MTLAALSCRWLCMTDVKYPGRAISIKHCFTSVFRNNAYGISTDMVGFTMIIKRTIVLMSDGTNICQIIEHLKVDGGYI